MADPSAGPVSTPHPTRGPAAAGLYTIIAIKLGKAGLLLLIALGIYSLMGENLRAEFEKLLRGFSLDPEQEFLTALARQLETVTPANLRWAASGSLLYAILLLVESVGLICRSFWAVWLAIGETAFFIPLEVFDVVRHPSWLVTAILVLNTLIVAYLVRNRERLFHHHHRRHPAAPPTSPSS